MHCASGDFHVDLFLSTLVVLALLYLVGHLTYRGDGTKSYEFLKVLAHLLLLFASNAVLFVVITLVSCAAYVALDRTVLDPTSYDTLLSTSQNLGTALGKFRGGMFLLILLILIFTTAIVQFLIRRFFGRHLPLWTLNEEGYEIGEYFIQWITIYLAVYQFFFEGLRDLMSLLLTSEELSETFSIVLSPRNINLVLQPVLISTWITVVMEKLRLRHQTPDKER